MFDMTRLLIKVSQNQIHLDFGLMKSVEISHYGVNIVVVVMWLGA
jgi:hypothetical protein